MTFSKTTRLPTLWECSPFRKPPEKKSVGTQTDFEPTNKKPTKTKTTQTIQPEAQPKHETEVIQPEVEKAQPKHETEVNQVRNPLTGRPIKVNGTVYCKLLSQGWKLENDRLVKPSNIDQN